MPTRVAIRFNSDMKTTYRRLVAAGKPPGVAIVTMMRKLAVLADALLEVPRNWTPTPA